MKDRIHLSEMEMKMLLSDTRFDQDGVRFVLVLEGQVHLQAGVKKSESGVACCEGRLS